MSDKELETDETKNDIPKDSQWKSEPILTKLTHVESLHSSAAAISKARSDSIISDNHDDEEETKWIPDHKHNQCMLCNASFSMLNRRHHCRKCGSLVCGRCSKGQCFTNNKWERVCDSCFESLTTNKPIINSHPHLQVLSEPNFFSWIALFQKSWIRYRYPHKYEEYKKQLLQQRWNKNNARAALTKPNPLMVVQTGLLYINIIAAHGLPDCDAFSPPDGYCIYYVTNNDPCFGETTKYSTKVQGDTYQPEWNEDETIVITNTTGKLIIELWDYDFHDSDDYLGKIEIDLNALFLHFSCNQARHRVIDDWFEVDLAEPYRNQHKRSPETLIQKYLSTSGILHITDDDAYHDDNLNITAVYKRLSVPSLSFSDSMEGKCYIHLQLKLHATFWGHFLSMFDPVLPAPPQPEPFSVDRFYTELNALLSYVHPIMSHSQDAMDTLFWIKYIWASLYVLTFVYCVFHLWFAVFWLQFRLLLFSCDSYRKQTDNKQIVVPSIMHCLCTSLGMIPTLMERICIKNQELVDADKASNKDKEENTKKDTKKDANIDTKELKEEDITMGVFTRMIGNNVVRVSGLKNNLGYYQELLVWINAMIKHIIELFTWKYVNITSMIVIGSSVSCLLLVIFRETALYQYQICCVGCCIMTYFSKPVQFLQWFYFGANRWYYEFHSPYTKFKTEMAASDPYISDEEEDEQDEYDTVAHVQDIETIKTYWYLMLEKLINVCNLCTDLVLGMIIFIKPIFDTTNTKRRADIPIFSTSKSEPVFEATSLYSSAVLVSALSETTRSNKYDDDEQITAKMRKKRPTLLRKRTLKRIENKANTKIGSMMTKLEKAKKLKQ